MEPLTHPPVTLVDLLDRILDRGLLLNADIIICLADVPLIGINLRAALAGVDTLAKYGLLPEWASGTTSEGKAPFLPAPGLLDGRVASAAPAGGAR